MKKYHLNLSGHILSVFNETAARYAAILALNVGYDERKFSVDTDNGSPIQLECESDFAQYCVEIASCVEGYRPILQNAGNFYPVDAIEEIAEVLHGWESGKPLPLPMEIVQPVVISQFQFSND